MPQSDAERIVVTPAGNISSTNVQDALEELDTDLGGKLDLYTSPMYLANSALTGGSIIANDVDATRVVSVDLTYSGGQAFATLKAEDAGGIYSEVSAGTDGVTNYHEDGGGKFAGIYLSSAYPEGRVTVETDGKIHLVTGVDDRITVNADGTVALHATTAASLAAALGGSSWTLVEKTTDETRTSTTTLTNDSTLSFSVAANTKYRFRFHVIFRSGDTPDFKFALTGPSSPTVLKGRYSVCAAYGSVVHYRPFGTYAGIAASLIGSPPGANDDGGFVYIEGILHNGANSGTVAFQWAQNTSDPSNTTVLAGSYIEYKAVA